MSDLEDKKAMFANFNGSELNDRIVDLRLEAGNSILDEWEGELDLYMEKRWPDAFKKFEEEERVEADVVALTDTHSHLISDHDAFYEAYRTAIQHVSSGGRCRDGELL